MRIFAKNGVGLIINKKNNVNKKNWGLGVQKSLSRKLPKFVTQWSGVVVVEKLIIRV